MEAWGPNCCRTSRSSCCSSCCWEAVMGSSPSGGRIGLTKSLPEGSGPLASLGWHLVRRNQSASDPLLGPRPQRVHCHCWFLWHRCMWWPELTSRATCLLCLVAGCLGGSSCSEVARAACSWIAAILRWSCLAKWSTCWKDKEAWATPVPACLAACWAMASASSLPKVQRLGCLSSSAARSSKCE